MIELNVELPPPGCIQGFHERLRIALALYVYESNLLAEDFVKAIRHAVFENQFLEAAARGIFALEAIVRGRHRRVRDHAIPDPRGIPRSSLVAFAPEVQQRHVTDSAGLAVLDMPAVLRLKAATDSRVAIRLDAERGEVGDGLERPVRKMQ